MFGEGAEEGKRDVPGLPKGDVGGKLLALLDEGKKLPGVEERDEGNRELVVVDVGVAEPNGDTGLGTVEGKRELY